MSLPNTMKAYKCQGPGKAELVDVPLPAMRPDYLMVKVSAVALNPTDWKHIDYMPKEGATVGCDFCGTVVEVGPEVNKSWKKGDRVAGFAHGVNAVQPEDGCFAEYAVVKGDVVMKVPDNLSDEEASTTGVSIATVGQGLYQSLGLPMPDKPETKKTSLLIYGGSTATGLFALQYAKLSGLNVVTTCSPKNFDLVKSYGADEAFDYSDASKCSASIREHTNNDLHHAFDCISNETSAKICADAMSPNGKGKYSSLLPLKFPRDDVESASTLAYTSIGERFEFRGGMVFEAKPEDFEFARGFWTLAERLLGEGKVKILPVDVRSGGLGGVAHGLEDMRSGKVSATKLVYRVAET